MRNPRSNVVGHFLKFVLQETVVMLMAPLTGPIFVYALKATNGVLDGHTLWTWQGDSAPFSVYHQGSATVLPQSDMIAVLDSYTVSPANVFEVCALYLSLLKRFYHYRCK